MKRAGAEAGLRRSQVTGLPTPYAKENTTRLVLPGNIKATGWLLPSQLSEAQWLQAGIVLGRLERTVLWLIGDWWRFGNKTYGSRKALVDRRDWEGPSYQTCRNAAAVAEKFQLSRRRDNLSFAHHSEVAALRADQADHWLDWCEETIATEGKPRSVRELRAQVQRRRPAVGAITSKATCTVKDLRTLMSDCRKFGCVYADPPWRYSNQATRSATDAHYGSMPITSSARASRAGGTSRPSVLAVLRLITSSNFVGCSTGRFSVFSPLRILPA